jgi:hypothetical protein
MKRIDEKHHITPRGIAISPHLTTPNSSKYDPAGVYETGLRITDKVVEQVFLTEMQTIHDAYLQSCQKEAQKQLRGCPPWQIGDDGSVVFKFKHKLSDVSDGKSWKNAPPKLFDSQRKPIDPDNKLRIGNGSEIRISFHVYPWRYLERAGILLIPKAVLLFKVVNYNDAAYFGFEAEEDPDGFVYSAPTKTEPQAAVEPYAPTVRVASPITDDDIPF